MGACLSTPAADAPRQAAPHATANGAAAGHSGKCAHDSVCSMDTSASRDSSVQPQHGKPSGATAAAAGPSKQQRAAPKHKLVARLMGRPNRHNQADRSSSSSTAGARSSKHGGDSSSTHASKHSGSKKKKRHVTVSITGQVIPDFSVQGVFDVLHELGSGGSGVTYLCRDLHTHKLVAVKFVDRPLPKAAIPFMMGEVELQAGIGEGHENIITMRELLLTRTHLGLVMDYASGGSLTEQVGCLWESALQRGGMFMEEQEACYYLRQFASALDYCHRHRVAHRDLKLDNTLLHDRVAGPPWIKICDFGFAKSWTGSDANMKTAIGTPVYMSPQMLAAKQCASGYSGQKADMWAVGVLLFVMLLGEFPFDHDPTLDPNSRKASDEVWLRQQAKGGWRQHPRAADALAKKRLSPDCVSLLDGLLQYDEDKRFTTEQVLQHPWLHIPLNAEQQCAWDELQAAQQALAQMLAEKSDPHVIRLRKQAMLGMLAIASKPPCSASLYPRTDLSPAPSGGALAGALTGGGTPTTSPSLLAAAADSAAAGPSKGINPPALATVSHGSAPHSPLAVGGDTPPATPAGGTELVSPAAAAAAAAIAASDRRGSGGLADSEGATVHLSFQAGEGIRSPSLEQRVEAHRHCTAELRAARMAASGGEQQPAAGGGASAAGSGAEGGRAGDGDSSSGGGMLPPRLLPVVSGDMPPGEGADSSGGAAATHGPGSSSPTSPPAAAPPPAPRQPSGSTKGGGAWSSKFKSPFAAAAQHSAAGSTSASTAARGAGGAGGGNGGSSASDGDDGEWDEGEDEVWRLPLTSTADPAAYKLSAELSVAAGALVRQLQKAGKLEGRGRTNRSSCPVVGR